MAVTPHIEFLPWYVAGLSGLTRCNQCFALVIEADQQGHVDWHDEGPAQPTEVPRPASRRTTMEDLVCIRPGCTKKGPHSHGRWVGEVKGT